MPKEAAIESEVVSRTDTRWTIHRPAYVDELQIVVTRYEMEVTNDGRHVECKAQFFLDEDGRWVEFPEGGEVRPCVRMSAVLLHTLREAPEHLLSHPAVQVLVNALNQWDETSVSGGHITLPFK